MTRAYVGMGSNEGSREVNLSRAVTALRGLPETRVLAVSSLYATEAREAPGHPDYLNAVVALETGLSADHLLRQLQQIERGLGRREGHRAAPRPLDLDLLYFGSQVMDRPGLQVPHPRIPERLFVLEPMTELAPGWMDPRTGLTMGVMSDRLRGTQQVRLAGRMAG